MISSDFLPTVFLLCAFSKYQDLKLGKCPMPPSKIHSLSSHEHQRADSPCRSSQCQPITQVDHLSSHEHECVSTAPCQLNNTIIHSNLHPKLTPRWSMNINKICRYFSQYCQPLHGSTGTTPWEYRKDTIQQPTAPWE
jgi:hypothetical protein